MVLIACCLRWMVDWGLMGSRRWYDRISAAHCLIAAPSRAMCAGTNCTSIAPSPAQPRPAASDRPRAGRRGQRRRSCVLEQRDDLGLGLAAGKEDHPLAARLVRVGAEHGGHEGV